MPLVTSDSKFRLAIIGGGMGGLVLGLCLKKYAPNVHFDIYESANELTELGAGISMSPRTWSIIKELGLEDELITNTGTQAPIGSPFTFRKGDEESVIDVFQLQQLHTLQRSILQQILTKHIGAGDRIHFSKRLTSYYATSSTSPITLNFKDGTTATCDLVVGSDGVRSAVRRTMFKEYADEAETRGQAEEAARLREMVEPGFSGQIAHRGLAPASALSEDALERTRAPQILIGKHGDIVMYPVTGGTSVNVLAVKDTPGHGRVYDGPWVESVTGEAVAKLFEGWQPWALAAIKLGGGEPIPLGDAHGPRPSHAHAMLPHLGAGAGQAFEDGFVLSLILAHPSVTPTNLTAALKIYDDLRRPFSQSVQRGSERNGATYHLRRAGSGWESITAEDSRAGRYPREWLAAIGEDVQAQFRWTFEANIEDDGARVAERLATLSA